MPQGILASISAHTATWWQRSTMCSGRKTPGARAHKQEAGDIWAKELGLPAAVAARFGEFNTNPIGPVGPAETTHIENITDWYVENRIIPTRPEIAPFVSDLSQR